MRGPWVTIVLVITATLWLGAAMHARATLAYSPDLAFNFDCGDKAQSALEETIESFLRDERFRVLNEGRWQRQHDVFLVDRILALDEKRRIIEFITIALPRLHRQGKHTVTFPTPPPTERSTQLEEHLERFVSETLACKVSQKSRGTNGAERKGFYDSWVARIENRFREIGR